MVGGLAKHGCWATVVAVGMIGASSLTAAEKATDTKAAGVKTAQSTETATDAAKRTPEFLAERSDVGPRASIVPSDIAQPGEHPLMPALRWAYDGISEIEKISDYTATLCKRERVNGKVGEYEYMYVKIRHKPFSVYMYFLTPASLKGQEVIFVDGKNDGNMWAHTTGIRDTLVGTVSLPPTGVIAMTNQRYPLTELGVLNLVRRLVEVGEQDIKYGECEVKFIKNAKINNRVCTCIQVVHPKARKNFLFHLARIFVDDELNVPIRYEAYDWPKEEGGEPELLEEYTYTNLKVNCGLTDADFDIKNPNYKFR